MTAKIIQELPHRQSLVKMSEKQREYETVVKCAHCFKILKYFGTVTFYNKRGNPGHRTLALHELIG